MHVHYMASCSWLLRFSVCHCSIQTDTGNEADVRGAAAQAIGGTTQYLRQTLADLLAQLAPRGEAQEVNQSDLIQWHFLD